MKIEKKLMISNIVITTIGMVILAIIIMFIVSGYIRGNIGKDLINQNQMIARMIHYEKKPKKVLAPFGRDKKPYVTMILDIKSGEINTYFHKGLTEYDIRTLLELEQEKAKEIKLFDKRGIAYSEVVSFESQEYLIATFIDNEDITLISNRILYVLISVVLGVCFLIIIVTRLSSRMITKPINELVKVAEKIGKKNFDDKVMIDTNDEFNTLARAINGMGDSLKRQDMEQKRFYENFSHELKTPLTVISGYAQGLKSGIVKEKDEALDIIVEECGYLKKQLENMIYLSKLDTVNELFQNQRINLNQVIGNALAKIDSLIIVGDIDIIFEPKEDVYIEGDGDKLTQVFINIFSNCIKYTKDTIWIQVESETQHIQVTVSDNGKGFSETFLQNPFGRTIIGEKAGSGIGLSIVKKIIDKHDGTIQLSNLKSGGASYQITLPQLCHN